MCAGGIVSARIPELYYGAKDPDFGACGSILNLFEENFRHHPKIVGHILEAECAGLLREFFAQVRRPLTAGNGECYNGQTSPREAKKRGKEAER